MTTTAAEVPACAVEEGTWVIEEADREPSWAVPIRRNAQGPADLDHLPTSVGMGMEAGMALRKAVYSPWVVESVVDHNTPEDKADTQKKRVVDLVQAHPAEAEVALGFRDRHTRILPSWVGFEVEGEQ